MADDSSRLIEILERGRDRRRAMACRELREWLIYGAGNRGQACAALLSGAGRVVRGFIDRNPRPVEGYPVFTPEDCGAGLDPGLPVLIAVHNPGANVAAIRAVLLARGMANVWTLPEVIDAWPELSYFWLAPSSLCFAAENELVRAHGLLADASSREWFESIVDMRINGAYEALPVPDPEHQYFPVDLPPLPDPLRFIDCGAYTGDTIAALSRAGASFARIAAFEPDPTSYRQLAGSVQDQDIYLFPCGVWESNAQLRFAADGSSSALSDQGEVLVQTLALDDAIPNFAPNFIKMDIEGAEPGALAGARRLISRYRPRLAISVYHRSEHLWSIPLQIAGWSLDYRFFMRGHAYNSFETVLYALPKS